MRKLRTEMGHSEDHLHRTPRVSFYNVLQNHVWKATKSQYLSVQVCAPFV